MIVEYGDVILGRMLTRDGWVKVPSLSAEQEARAIDLTERYDVQLSVARKWVTGETDPPSWVKLIPDGNERGS